MLLQEACKPGPFLQSAFRASDGEGCSSLFLELHLPSLAKPWRNTRTLMVLRWLQTAGSGQRRVYRKCPGGCSMADHGYSEATAVCCQLWTIGNCVCAQTRVCNESPGRKSWEANGTHAIWCSVPTRAACTGSATKGPGRFWAKREDTCALQT